MKVSIAIPFYNASKFVISTLESVKNQTYGNIELLLYDDFSKDDSVLLVKNWLETNNSRFCRVYFEGGIQNMGASFATNQLFKQSSGDFFQMLGADDILLPDKISNQVAYLLEHTEYALVYSNAYRINENGIRLSEDYFIFQKFRCIESDKGPQGYLFKKLIIENFIPASSVLARRNAIEVVGGYDPLIRSEDWDLWLRISKCFQIGFIDSKDVEYRIHSDSSMQNKSFLSDIFRSFVTSLFKHYGLDKQDDKILSGNIYRYSIGMYRLGKIDLKYLLKNFIVNKSFRSFFYLMFGLLKIRINQIK